MIYWFLTGQLGSLKIPVVSRGIIKRRGGKRLYCKKLVLPAKATHMRMPSRAQAGPEAIHPRLVERRREDPFLPSLQPRFLTLTGPPGATHAVPA